MHAVFGLWSHLSPQETRAAFQRLELRLTGGATSPPANDQASAAALLGVSGAPVLYSPNFILAADVRLDSRGTLLAGLGQPETANLDDRALLAAAWQRWGEGCVEHLVGAFAFAVWSAHAQTLWLVRDHAGEYPLFYTQTEHFLAFASRPTALQALPGVEVGLDEQRVLDTLTIFPPEWTSSFLKGVKRVPSGHFLRVSRHRAQLVRYWHPSDVRPLRLGSNRAYEEALVDLLDRATADRLRTSGEIGSHLSAGLDSTSVTASAAITLQGSGKKLTAFTAVPRPDFQGVGRPQDIVDESLGAALVARMYPNIDHVLVDTRGKRLLEDAKPVTDAMGEPLLNIGNWMWMAKMFEAARERRITVMLNGSSGNATLSFDGITGLRELFRQRRWPQLVKAVQTLRADGEIGMRNAAALALRGLLPDALRRLLQPQARLALLGHAAVHPQLAADRKLEQRAYEAAFLGDKDTAAERRSFYERFDFGAVNFGTEATTGISFRDPTGDKRLWEFCYAIPLEQYLADGHSRSLVRRAMRRRLPPEVIQERRIGLQGADWYLTVREAVPELLAELDKMELSPTARRLLDLDRMRWLLNNWPSGGFERRDVAFAWNFALTRGMILGYFIRTNDPVALQALSERS